MVLYSGVLGLVWHWRCAYTQLRVYRYTGSELVLLWNCLMMALYWCCTETGAALVRYWCYQLVLYCTL